MRTRQRFYALNTETGEHAMKNTSAGQVQRTWASLRTLFEWIDEQGDDYAWIGHDSSGRFYDGPDSTGWLRD